MRRPLRRYIGSQVRGQSATKLGLSGQFPPTRVFRVDRISITYKPSLVCLFFTHTNSTPCHRQFAYLWATQDRRRQSGKPPRDHALVLAARLKSLSSPEKDQPILDVNQGPSATDSSKLPGLQLPYDPSDALIGDRPLRLPRIVSLIGHFYPSSGTDFALRAYLQRQPYLLC